MKPDPPRRRVLQIASLALALFVIVGVLSGVPVIRELQVRVTDTLFQLAPAPKDRSRVVLVLIDDESLQKYGRWPWSRDLLVRLTTNLSQAQAATIGLDILLSEPQSPEADRALSEALAASGRAIIVDKIASFPEGIRWIEPLSQFARAAAVGHAHAVLDPDAVCRRFPPRELTLDGPRWAFAVEVARRTDPQRTASFLAAYGIAQSLDSQAMIVAKPVLAPIAFRRDSFDTISAARVLQGFDLGAVRGRPVLVGFGPTEIGDRLTTPLSAELPTPGVEVHAQILDNILAQRILRESPLWLMATLLFLTSVVVIVLFRRWRGFHSLTLLLLMGAFVYGCSLLAFTWTLRVIPAGPLMLAVLLGPLLVYTGDFVNVERSVSRQLHGLRSWLALRGRELPPEDKTDLSWRLDLLQKLQTELGSLYELHETLLESTQDLVAIFDHDGNLLLKNRGFSAAFRQPQESILTLDRVRSRLVSKEDAPLAANNAIEEGEVYLDQELYSVRIAPLPPTTLSPGGGTILTLTNLRTRVERDHARAEALGFITHELRTPIASIQGFAELMMQYPGSQDSSGAPRTIYLESKRLLALISSYLDVLRLDAGAKPLSSSMVDLVGMVHQVFDILQPLAHASGMKLVLEGPKSLPVIADPNLISGAILNLVSNAIKYGRPNTDIRVGCEPKPDEVLITVHNFGTPITGQQIPRIFEPYYRASNPESTKTGWGLGLAFVKRIAEKHRGSVYARSTGNGMVFEIHLPARSDASMSAKEAL
jgi:signal transduction histidine kinase/CHASE2 domain-containing sensor protein